MQSHVALLSVFAFLPEWTTVAHASGNEAIASASTCTVVGFVTPHEHVIESGRSEPRGRRW